MKKTFVFGILFIWSVVIGQSQYYLLPVVQNGMNPGNLNRDAELPQNSGLPAGWMTILVGPQASGNWSATFQIPFKFYFNGALVKNYKASTSGIVTFNTRTSIRVDSNNVELPTSRIPDSSICIWGLRAAQGDFIVIKTFGKEPHRQLWISYNSFSEHNLKSGGHIYASIVLEESTNKIFLVDQRTICRLNNVDCTDKTDLTLGIQIDSTNAIMVPGSPNYASENQNLSTVSDNAYYEFIPGPRQDIDIESQSHLFKDYYLYREFPLPVVGRFKNIGNSVINSVEYHYQIEKGQVYDGIINGLNINPLDEFSITHPIPWQNLNTGFSQLEIRSWISKINGNSTTQPADDTLYSQMIVNDSFFERKLMHEFFASPTSNPTKSAYDTMSSVLNQFPGLYTALRYPMASPQGGDPYHSIEAAARGRYYNLSNNAIPSAILDGRSALNPTNYNTQTFTSIQNVPSFYQLNAAGSVKGQTVNVQIELITEAPIVSNTKLYVAISEKKTTKNIKTNGELEFHHVLKKFLPDTLGIVMDPLPQDTSVLIQLSWEVPGSYRLPVDGRAGNIINLDTEHSIEDFSNLEVIAWLQESDRSILQSNSASLDYTVATDDNTSKTFPIVYPNPANEVLVIDLRNIETHKPVHLSITDSKGNIVFDKLVDSKLTLVNTVDWNPGLYVVRANTMQSLYHSKLLILH